MPCAAVQVVNCTTLGSTIHNLVYLDAALKFCSVLFAQLCTVALPQRAFPFLFLRPHFAL